MVIWDDVARELEKINEALEGWIKSFESIEKIWQELIDYANTM